MSSLKSQIDDRPDENLVEEDSTARREKISSSCWRRAVEPGEGLGTTLLVLGFLLLMVFHQNLIVVATYILVVGLVMLLAIISVALLIEPPVPFRNKSALINRLSMLINSVLKTLVFCAAGIYGAIVALSLDMHISEISESYDIRSFLIENVLTVTLMVFVFSFWYMAFACAWDLLRTSSPRKKHAIIRGKKIVSKWLKRKELAHEDVLDKLLDWYVSFAIWCVNRWLPFVFAYLSILLIIPIMRLID